MIQKGTISTGAVLLLAGILGFVPGVTVSGVDGQPMLFGVFMVGPFHNGFHLLSGALGLLASASERYSYVYLWMFGLVYIVLAVLGFTVGIGGVNVADHLLHTAIAAVVFGLIFFAGRKEQEWVPSG